MASNVEREQRQARMGYQAEHWLAWLLAAVAIGMGVIGLLRGFEIIGSEAGVGAAGQGADGVLMLSRSMADGQLWMFSAMAVALVGWALHKTEGARARHSATQAEQGQYLFERWLAWLFAVASLGLAGLALLVGFGILDDARNQYDGMLWAFAGIGTGMITNTLRSVRHHLVEADEEYIATLVSERMGPTTPRVTGTGRPEPGIERR